MGVFEEMDITEVRASLKQWRGLAENGMRIDREQARSVVSRLERLLQAAEDTQTVKGQVFTDPNRAALEALDKWLCGYPCMDTDYDGYSMIRRITVRNKIEEMLKGR